MEEALSEVAANGWTQEAKLCAQCALMSLHPETPPGSGGSGVEHPSRQHIMMSCELASSDPAQTQEVESVLRQTNGITRTWSNV